MLRSHRLAVAVTTLTVGSLACAESTPTETSTPLEKDQAAERIDDANDPSRFQLQLSRAWSELPASGESIRKPFPSNWWPMLRGGIAWRWQGESVPSPAEKYDQLVRPDQIREVQLTKAQKDWQDMPVNPDAQPETFRIGPAAEWELRNSGPYGEVYPEGWWGHCNGWASYTLNEDEPTRPVEVRYDAATRRVRECAAGEAGCVRFELGDINALGAELYWSDAARMLGRRCEDAESDFEFDEAGRIDKVECRDGNAGSFHIVVTNMIGRMQRPFIVDLTADRQVWNYPVYRYELVKNREIGEAEALRLVGTSSRSWVFNPDARRFVEVELRAWIVEDAIPPSREPAGPLLSRYTTIERYSYVLELAADGTIIGGEWTGASKTRHPDFLWYSFASSPYGDRDDDAWDRDNPQIGYRTFKQILTLAQQSAVPVGGGDVVRAQAAPNLPIPDADPTGVRHVLDVNAMGAVASARVDVSIRHSYRGDLRVVLEHDGRRVVLHDQAGGSADDLELSVELPTLVGATAGGPWTLHVVDTYRQDTGSLAGWSIEVRTDTGAGGGGGGSGGGGSGGGGSGGGSGGGGTGSGSTQAEAAPAAPIPDNSATGVSSTIELTDDRNLGEVTVTVAIAHSYRGDLELSLAHGGRTAVLWRREGGSADDLRQSFTLRDFAGLPASGPWVLTVADRAAQDTGTLERWSIAATLDEGGTGGGGGGGGSSGGPVVRSFDGPGGLAIPDADPNGIRPSVTVTEALRLSGVRVELELRHPYVGDLEVALEKDGQRAVLHARSGGGADDLVRAYDPPGFSGASSQGEWVLSVRDLARADVGRLVSWRLVLTGTAP